MRAAFRLQEALREPRGAQIHLEKKVPMGAGLGGGSSDAAATLLSLLKLWKRKIPQKQLEELAVKLGADVPFFLRGGLCAATGIGEKLKALPELPKTWMVLVYPGFGVATKAAYARVQLPFPDSQTLQKKNLTGNLYNRFENLVFPDHPQLPALKQHLIEAGAVAALYVRLRVKRFWFSSFA